MHDPANQIPGPMCPERYRKLLEERPQHFLDMGYHVCPSGVPATPYGANIFLDTLEENPLGFKHLLEGPLLAGHSTPQDAKNAKSDVSPTTEKPKNNPEKNVQAFLKLLRTYEHSKDDPSVYYKIFGGSSFKDDKTHPFEQQTPITIRGKKYTAAGAYQITIATWRDAKKNGWAKDFTPASQDNIALALIRQAGALALIEAGNIEHAIPKLLHRWSSLPGGAQNTKMSNLQDARISFDKFVAE